MKKAVQYITDLRIKSGFTQDHIGRVLGFGNGQFVSNWERQTSDVPLAKVPKILKMLNGSKEEFTRLYLEDAKEEVERAFKK